MALSFNHLLSSSDLEKNDITTIIKLATQLKPLLESHLMLDLLSNRLLCTAFFEPSTRTRLSFETAMNRLGGRVISVEQGMVTTSSTKGESLADMGRVFATYADVIAVRHPEVHSVSRLAQLSSVPVINGGDGKNQHPSQALVDLFTIHEKFGRLDNLSIGFLGDLKYGRTVHSLLEVLHEYSGNRYSFISDESLTLPEEYKHKLTAQNEFFKETDDLESVLPTLDVLYVTRVQHERFQNNDDYQRVADRYHIDLAVLKASKKDLMIMHPLPRVNEISPTVDHDPRAYYFTQVSNGIVVRMALLLLLLEPEPFALIQSKYH